ncbi:hypothetical protein B0H66DRAFT_623763 [Apodospora peruviana]|uniref:Uncharacterized protein n=1 Tax=Apodospora peruviana TaxID=516989 RepID=A0AAE0I665_9PEZI|nr:hypothetical protein B0H66DRAFT_623763 [Apodospora peruviana]
MLRSIKGRRIRPRATSALYSLQVEEDEDEMEQPITKRPLTAMKAPRAAWLPMKIQDFLRLYRIAILTKEIAGQPFEPSPMMHLYGLTGGVDEKNNESWPRIRWQEQHIGLRSIPNDSPALSAKLFKDGKMVTDGAPQLFPTRQRCKESIILDRELDGRRTTIERVERQLAKCPNKAQAQGELRSLNGDVYETEHSEFTVCADLTHYRRHALCLQCSDKSRKTILEGCPGQDHPPLWHLTPRRIQDSRAYLCAPCTRMHIATREFKRAEAGLFHSEIQAPVEASAAGPSISAPSANADDYSFHTTTQVSASAATRDGVPVDDDSSEEDRISAKVNNKFNRHQSDLPCPVCTRNKGVDAYEFEGEDGGEDLLEVEWACLVCQEFVARPAEEVRRMER